MKTLTIIFSELFGLFVDDGFMAIAIIALVIVGTFLTFSIAAPGLLVGAMLFAGCIGILLVNVAKGARRS